MINKDIGQRFDTSLTGMGSSQNLGEKEESSGNYSFGDVLSDKETKADKEEKKQISQLEIERTESQSEIDKKEYNRFLERQNLALNNTNLAAGQQMAQNLPINNPMTHFDQKNITPKGNQIVNHGEVGIKDLQKLMSQRGITFNQLDSQQMGKLYTMHSRTEVTSFLNQLTKNLRYDNDKNVLSSNAQLLGDKKDITGEKVKASEEKKKLGDKKEDLEASAAENIDKKQGLPLSQFFDQAKLSEFKQGSPMEQQILKQIMDKMEINTEKAKSEVALRLNPEYLGEVKLNMTIDKDKGTVSVNFKTGSRAAKKTLEGNVKSLEDAFAAAGLKLDKFEVSIDDQLA